MYKALKLSVSDEKLRKRMTMIFEIAFSCLKMLFVLAHSIKWRLGNLKFNYEILSHLDRAMSNYAIA